MSLKLKEELSDMVKELKIMLIEELENKLSPQQLTNLSDIVEQAKKEIDKGDWLNDN